MYFVIYELHLSHLIKFLYSYKNVICHCLVNCFHLCGDFYQVL